MGESLWNPRTPCAVSWKPRGQPLWAWWSWWPWWPWHCLIHTDRPGGTDRRSLRWPQIDVPWPFMSDWRGEHAHWVLIWRTKWYGFCFCFLCVVFMGFEVFLIFCFKSWQHIWLSQGCYMYIRMAKWACLSLSRCAIWKYGRHIRSVIMSDDRGSIMANHYDFILSLNFYDRWYYY